MRYSERFNHLFGCRGTDVVNGYSTLWFFAAVDISHPIKLTLLSWNAKFISVFTRTCPWTLSWSQFMYLCTYVLHFPPIQSWCRVQRTVLQPPVATTGIYDALFISLHVS